MPRFAEEHFAAILHSHLKIILETLIAMRKALRPIALALLFSLSFAGGCKKQVSPGGLFPVTLQTDWYPQPEHGGFYEALMKGYYKQEGLDVTIVPGGPFVIGDQQVASGAANFSMGSSDSVLVSVSRGLPLVAVAATLQRDPQGIMVHKDSPVRTFADLNGHAVAVKPGSIWFQYLVKKFHLDNVREIPATYSVANFLADPNYIQQAFVTSEPYFAQKGGAEVRMLQVSDTGYSPYRVYFTSQTFVKEHPEIVAKFVRASTKGWRDYIADPSIADAEINRLNPAMSADQMEFSARTLKEMHFETGDGPDGDQLGRFTPERWNTMYQQLVDLKVITNPIDPATAYTLKFLPQ
jgi:NitT/TauT family transport system substrate-binding protein